MNTYKVGAVAALLAASMQAGARGDNTLDLYYVPVANYETEVGSFNDSDGYGAKGRFRVVDQVFLSGNYQVNNYRDLDGSGTDATLEWLRIGGDYFVLAPSDGLFVRGEYVRTDFEYQGFSFSEDSGDSGFGIHAGYVLRTDVGLELYGHAGYLALAEGGFEFVGGAAYGLTEALGLFADYRYTDIDLGQGFSDTFGDLRTGLRLRF